MTRFIHRCACNIVLTKASLYESLDCHKCGKTWEAMEPLVQSSTWKDSHDPGGSYRFG